MLRPGTLERKSQSQEGCSDGDPPNPALLPSKLGEGHSTAYSEIGMFSSLERRQKGQVGQFSAAAKKFNSRGECSTITVNSSPTSKELGWKLPFNSGKFALILLVWGELSTSSTGQSALQRHFQRKKEKQTNGEGNHDLLPQLFSGG